MQQSNCTVYMHKNKINNKIYIGMTELNPILRWNKGKGYKSNKMFYNDILKYTWNNFEHIILYENLTKEEAIQKEFDLIKQYNSTNKEIGYNLRNIIFKEKNIYEKITLHINVGENLKKQLKKEAEEKGMTLSTYVRTILMEKVNKYK